MTAAKSLQIFKLMEKQQLQAILGEAYELQTSTSESSRCLPFSLQGSAPALPLAYEMLRTAASFRSCMGGLYHTRH